MSCTNTTATTLTNCSTESFSSCHEEEEDPTQTLVCSEDHHERYPPTVVVHAYAPPPMKKQRSTTTPKKKKKQPTPSGDLVPCANENGPRQNTSNNSSSTSIVRMKARSNFKNFISSKKTTPTKPKSNTPKNKSKSPRLKKLTKQPSSNAYDMDHVVSDAIARRRNELRRLQEKMKQSQQQSAPISGGSMSSSSGGGGPPFLAAGGAGGAGMVAPRQLHLLARAHLGDKGGGSTSSGGSGGTGVGTYHSYGVGNVGGNANTTGSGVSPSRYGYVPSATATSYLKTNQDGGVPQSSTYASYGRAPYNQGSVAGPPAGAGLTQNGGQKAAQVQFTQNQSAYGGANSSNVSSSNAYVPGQPMPPAVDVGTGSTAPRPPPEPAAHGVHPPPPKVSTVTQPTDVQLNDSANMVSDNEDLLVSPTKPRRLELSSPGDSTAKAAKPAVVQSPSGEDVDWQEEEVLSSNVSFPRTPQVSDGGAAAKTRGTSTMQKTTRSSSPDTPMTTNTGGRTSAKKPVATPYVRVPVGEALDQSAPSPLGSPMGNGPDSADVMKRAKKALSHAPPSTSTNEKRAALDTMRRYAEDAADVSSLDESTGIGSRVNGKAPSPTASAANSGLANSHSSSVVTDYTQSNESRLIKKLSELQGEHTATLRRLARAEEELAQMARHGHDTAGLHGSDSDGDENLGNIMNDSRVVESQAYGLNNIMVRTPWIDHLRREQEAGNNQSENDSALSFIEKACSVVPSVFDSDMAEYEVLVPQGGSGDAAKGEDIQRALVKLMIADVGNDADVSGWQKRSNVVESLGVNAKIRADQSVLQILPTSQTARHCKSGTGRNSPSSGEGDVKVYDLSASNAGAGLGIVTYIDRYGGESEYSLSRVYEEVSAVRNNYVCALLSSAWALMQQASMEREKVHHPLTPPAVSERQSLNSQPKHPGIMQDASVDTADLPSPKEKPPPPVKSPQSSSTRTVESGSQDRSTKAAKQQPTSSDGLTTLILLILHSMYLFLSTTLTSLRWSTWVMIRLLVLAFIWLNFVEEGKFSPLFGFGSYLLGSSADSYHNEVY